MASVLIMDKTINLVWVIRKTQVLENRPVPEFLGVESDEGGSIDFIGNVDFETLQANTTISFCIK